jgi:hypothetical protein
VLADRIETGLPLVRSWLDGAMLETEATPPFSPQTRLRAAGESSR